MEVLLQTQSLVVDTFITLPLLLIGFTFFYGTLTSNIGLLYLFLGQLVIVPMISFLENDEERPWMKDGKFDFMKLLKYLVSFGSISSVFAFSGSSDQIFTLVKYISVPIAFLIHTLLVHFSPTSKPASPNCALIPGMSDTDTIYNQPSSWLNQLTFFVSFVFTNAFTLYNLPSPSITPSGNPDTDNNRQAALDQRINTRKGLAAGIMGIVLFVFLVLLIFRFNKTPCEAGFLRSILPLFVTAMVGHSWFSLVYEKCGVRPMDVLGIVQGLISPELIDNPIICVGS